MFVRLLHLSDPRDYFHLWYDGMGFWDWFWILVIGLGWSRSTGIGHFCNVSFFFWGGIIFLMFRLRCIHCLDLETKDYYGTEQHGSFWSLARTDGLVSGCHWVWI